MHCLEAASSVSNGTRGYSSVIAWAGSLNASEKVLPASRVATAGTRKTRDRGIILDASVDYQQCEQVVRDVMELIACSALSSASRLIASGNAPFIHPTAPASSIGFLFRFVSES